MGDRDEDGLLNFGEFAAYCAEHEKNLWLVFQGMDTNKDGSLLSPASIYIWVWFVLQG